MNYPRMLGCAAGAAIFLGSVSSALADYPSEVLSLGPINYWRLNEAGPVPAPISAVNLGTLGAAGNGTYVNGIRGIPGALVGDAATAASFQGDNSRVTVPFDATAMGSTSFSMEAWVRPAVSPPPAGQSSLAAVLSCGHLADPRSGWLIYQAAGGWNLRGYTGAGTATSINITGGPAPVAGTWYHIAATFNGSVAKVYVNGVVAATSGTIANYAGNADGVFSIGSRSDVAFPYNGDVDEVALYSTELSAETIAARYAAGVTPSPVMPYQAGVLASSPAVYLRLNEAPYVPMTVANTGTRGSAANGAFNPNATITDGPTAPAFPAFEAGNKSPTFDGLTGSINCGTNASLNGTTDFSIIAWVKTTATARGTIIQQRDVDGAVAGYNGEYKVSVNDDGTVQFMLYKDGYQFDYASTTTLVNDGNWHQVVVVRKGLDGFTYIDGEQAGTATGTEIKELVGAIKTFIGRDMRDFVEPFNGNIDEVAVFDKAISAGTVSSLYATAAGISKAPVMVTDPPTVTPPTTIYATTSFSISADVSGSLPMTFQWRKDGTVVGTSRDYKKASATLADSGNYDVIVSNAAGSVTSAVVNVTINPAEPPSVVTPPVSRFVYPGGGASFTVEAAGTPPLSYQWKKGTALIDGATNQTLRISNASAADVASYSVAVKNVAGTINSTGASLTLRTPTAGTYEAAVVASGPLSYWRLGEKTGTTALDYAGGNDGTYSLVTLGQPGFSTVDSDTSVSFDKASLSSIPAPGVSFNYTGSTPSFTLETWANLTDFTSNQRLFSFGGPGFRGIGFGVLDAGTLRFTTYGVQDFNLALPMTLEPGVWYHIVGVANGGSFYFYVNGQLAGSIAFTGAGQTANGTPPFMLGRNALGVDETISGSMDEAAIYTKALTADEIQAHYSVGRFGSSTPPTIIAQPASQTVVLGSAVTLSVSAQGSVPLSYVWKKGTETIPGATTSKLTIASASFADAGSYTVTVSNNAGSKTSDAAVLAVMPAPTFANLTNDLVLHLRFDGNYSDTSGKANDASPVGTPPFIGGKIGQGVHIATTPGDSYLVVNDVSQELSFDETASFTVSYWLKYTARFNDVPIIGNAINSTYQLGWVFTDEGGKIEYSLVSTANSGTYVADPVSGSPAIDNGAWHHIVGVVNRATETALVYVDGILAGTWSIKGLGTLATGNNITIGQDPTGAYGSATFDLDDVGIWRRALSGYDVQSIYNAAQGAGQSFDIYGPVKLQIVASGADLIVAWQAGTLEASDNVNTGWAPVAGASAPAYKISPSAAKKFYRIRL